jgi:hypothetical protein
MHTRRPGVTVLGNIVETFLGDPKEAERTSDGSRGWQSTRERKSTANA